MTDPDVYRRLERLERWRDELAGLETATPIDRYDTTFAYLDPTDHFRGSTLNAAWSWLGAPLNGTPSVVDLSIFPSHLVLGDNQGAGANKYVLSRSFSGSRIAARILPQLNCAIGIRLDDGDDNDYTELLVADSGTAGMMDLIARRRTGGGGVTDTKLITALPQHPITLMMALSGGNALYYYSLEPHIVHSAAANFMRFASILAWAITPTRAGITYGNAAGADGGGFDRRCAVDWYHAF